jgi:S-disulfanyl-L-cysteine oxidoreductase SoxD
MILFLWACGTPRAPESPEAGASPTPATIAPGASAPAATASVALPDRFDLGRPPTPEEVAAVDIDVNASWEGLPPGRGTVEEGRALYSTQCAACHGPDAKGGKGLLGPQLVATEPLEGFEKDPKAPRVIGTWWPYASTLFDYVRRAMPQTAPGSLTDDQTYALVAFLLAENQAVPPDFVADQDSIKGVEMPTKVRFVRDDRESTNQFR